VVVVHPYMSVLGGGEQVCLHIVKALVEEGHEVNLVSDLAEKNKLAQLVGLNVLEAVKHITYNTFEPKIKKFSIYQRIFHHRPMKDKIKKQIQKADLEFLTQDVIFLSDIGKETVAYVHYPEYFMHLEEASAKSRWFWKLYYAPVQWHLHRKVGKIKLFICNSEYTKKAIEEKWGKKAVIVYPPVDVTKIKPMTKERFVVSVGRFVKEKNYEMVLKVAKLLPKVKFVIIGRKQDRDYYERIKDQKTDNVALFADLPQAELFSMLGKAKVYLHAMIGEHFGISIVEAMAAGCVPVVHNSGGARDIVHNVGYVYDDVEECSEYVQQALSEEVDTSKIVEKAKNFSSERFKKQIKETLKENGIL